MFLVLKNITKKSIQNNHDIERAYITRLRSKIVFGSNAVVNTIVYRKNHAHIDIEKSRKNIQLENLYLRYTKIQRGINVITIRK